MKGDCHVHFALDGWDWKASLARHAAGNDEALLKKTLSLYREKGYRYLRCGGDRFGAGLRAKALAPEFGIRVVTPLAPLYRRGHYGSFIGLSYESDREFAALVERQKAQGADFVKIMISGLMDFDRPGVLTEPSLAEDQIRALIRIAHDLGQRVMVHGNGSDACLAAADTGADSIEHGAYLHGEALAAMAENKVVWVPTLSAVGNLLGRGRFSDRAVEEILHGTMENVSRFASMEGLIAPGSDAGAWGVEHGCDTEEKWLSRALGTGACSVWEQGLQAIRERF